MIVICVMTTRAVIELNRVDVERKRLGQARLRADARECGAIEGLAAQVRVRRQRQPRAAHAHERRPRHDQPPARLRSHPTSSASTSRPSARAAMRSSRWSTRSSTSPRSRRARSCSSKSRSPLANCVDEVVNLLALNARRNGINLISYIEPHVLPSYMGDTSRVRQVLVNLIGNAVKFTEKGEVTLRVTSEPVSDNVYRLEFLVSDTGPGISPDAIGKLFRPFQQGDASATRKHGGTGLGLTITKRLVELMDGEVTVSSTLGAGSTFRFTLCLPSCPMDGLVPEDKLPSSCRLVIVAREGNYPVLLKRQLEGLGREGARRGRSPHPGQDDRDRHHRRADGPRRGQLRPRRADAVRPGLEPRPAHPARLRRADGRGPRRLLRQAPDQAGQAQPSPRRARGNDRRRRPRRA